MSSQPNVLILRAPGTNCDEETAFAFEIAGAKTASIHINELLAAPDRLSDFQILCLPGGFSYGDDVAAGQILALQLQSNLADVLRDFHAQGKLILGICNGFQVLMKSGLLPGADAVDTATLTWNDSGRFLDTWVHLNTDDHVCVFLKDVGQLELPIAHAEGKFVARDTSILNSLEQNHQLAIKYCKADGPNGHVPYPENPNGSEGNVAGLCDPTGRIFGLMPHPERNIDRTHHPRWTRDGGMASGTGLALFKNAVNFFH